MVHEFMVWVGVDWGREQHQVCIVNAQGKVVGERKLQHTGEELKALCDELATLGEPGCVAVGIETPHGPVVETLLERGFAVFAINPKQLDRFRDRFTVAGSKDDRLDARVLAESLRTDQPRFRRLQLGSPTELALREGSRLCDELQKERLRWLNRLGDALWRYFPAMLGLGEGKGTDWFLALCDTVPTPQHAQCVDVATIEALLRKHRVRCIDAATVLERLRAPAPAVPAAIVESTLAHVALCIAHIRLLNQQHRDALRHLDKLTAQLAHEQAEQNQRDVEILDSLPGVGRIVLAALIAEAAEPLRHRDYHALRALSGVAPVTRRSGKSLSVKMRRACNPRLREAMYHCSRIAMSRDPSCRQRYRTLRRRGKKHGHALREIADHLLFVTCTLLRTNQPYDPARRQLGS